MNATWAGVIHALLIYWGTCETWLTVNEWDAKHTEQYWARHYDELDEHLAAAE